MLGSFTVRLAVEVPDGELRVFNAPEGWTPLTLYVSRNNIIQWRGFTFVGGTQVEFEETPQVGDTIGFVYNS